MDLTSDQLPLKICMVASEVVPLAKTGGLADVVGALAIEFAKLGHDVCVMLPAYRQIDELGYQMAEGVRLAVPSAHGPIDACVQEVFAPQLHVRGGFRVRDVLKAVCRGIERAKKVINNPRRGQFKKYGKPVFRYLQEVRVDNVEAFGDEVTVNIFDGITKVDVIGTSKGKGFQGTMKRHNFAGGPASHGHSVTHRAPGSIGQRQTPGRVFKGKKMAGHMGNVNQSMQNLEIVQIDAERHLLAIKGSVPGAAGGDVVVRAASKG